MGFGTVFFVFFLLAASEAVSLVVTLVPDRPSLRVPVSHKVSLECCYKCSTILQVTWIRHVVISRNLTNEAPVNTLDGRVKMKDLNKESDGVWCNHLEMTNVLQKDTGLYQCLLNHTNMDDKNLRTPGTYLQVFKPIHKTLNISERMKNNIITAEGVLLLICVLLPGLTLLYKANGLKELEKRKGKEEENIYEGLNLDDCASTYYQIQRSQVQGTYQDVMTTVGEDIQLEKP